MTRRKRKSVFRRFLKEYGILSSAAGFVVGLVFKDLIHSIVFKLLMPVLSTSLHLKPYEKISVRFMGKNLMIGETIGYAIDLFVIVLVLYIIVRIIMGKEEFLEK
ncbi:MAG: hypothetical protein DRH51_00585 [Candidatus Coatesbacteria bacterium]|nr:MAG: hypothetical protein DRH49_05710 [Candidatus Coatesbacteria bacterium]RLC42515.1 MAG: hypothetical protein DRH51_00585 [Candidatus Coatesbacteria bacterium]RLC44054.1 MAG: hypothetical protein DRH44_03525 [Candidatus Coatesbacteria bacterium]HEC80439.1 hypothetical protein [Bacillota bacterium]